MLPGYTPSELPEMLPSDVRELLPDGMQAYFAGECETADIGSPQNWLSVLVEIARNTVTTQWNSLCTLLGFLILLSAVNTWGKDVMNGRVGTVIRYLSVLCLGINVHSILKTAWTSLSDSLTSMTVFADSILPVMGVLYAADGQVACGTAASGGFALAVSLLENVNAFVLFPVLQVCFAFTLLSGMCPELHLDGLSKTVRSIFTGLLTVIMSLLSLILSVQTVLSRAADTMTLKTVKFAVSNMIPLVGGVLSDAAQTLAGGMGYIRTTVGAFGIAGIVLVVLPPLCSLIWYKIIFGISSAVGAAVGAEKESKFLDGCGEIVNFGIALLCASAVLFILVFILFVCTVSHAV